MVGLHGVSLRGFAPLRNNSGTMKKVLAAMTKLTQWVFLACTLVLLSSCRTHRAPQAQTRSFWYWHTPFQLTASQRTDLDLLGVRDLFVRAATMSFDGEHMQAILPQRWLSPWPRVWLVLNFDGGARGHFAEVAPRDVAAQTVKAFLDAKRAAVGSGIVGLQIDLDCPTRRLPRYADLLREVRRLLPKDT